MNAALPAALALAEEYGLPVFPCREREEIVNGKKYGAKSPYPEHGFKDASTNIEQIAQWWQRWPDALVGVPTGAATKLVVVDVDPDGLGWYRENARRLACGRIHTTPRGFHLLYRMPAGAEIRNSASKIAPGVDVRGEGGFIIWWPAHGREAVGDMADLAEPPPLDALAAPAPKVNGEDHSNAASTRDLVREGRRNDYLSREAYRLRKTGSTVEQIAVILQAINQARCTPPLPESEVLQTAGGKAQVEPEREQHEAPSIVLRHIADIVAERREAQWLKGLHRVLERNVLAVLAGSRNTFKSFIAHHWAMTAAQHGENVVILSAEGAGLDRRTDAWMRTYAPSLDLRKLQMRALERAVNLTSLSTLEALQAAITDTPALIVVDTYSKYAPGLDENDNAEVAFYLATLGFSLRDRYKSTVLLVAHAGHADAKRPRGASVLMSNPDAEYIVTRADALAMTASVTRQRFKDSPSVPPLAYNAEVVDLGRMDSYGEPVTSLVMRDGDYLAALAASKPELHGKSQRRLLGLLKEEKNAGIDIWTLGELRAIGRKAGMHRNTAHAAAEALTFSAHMVATVGGWRLAD